MAEKPKYQGTISRGTLAEFIQFLAHDRTARGHLTVTCGDHCGRVWFDAGQIVTAEVDFSRDEEALRQMLRYREGTFSFVPADRAPERRIRRDTMGLLLALMAELDEEGEPLRAPGVGAVAWRAAADDETAAPPPDNEVAETADVDTASGPAGEGNSDVPARRVRVSRAVYVGLALLIAAEIALAVWFLHPMHRRRWMREAAGAEEKRALERKELRLTIEAFVDRGDAAMRRGYLDEAQDLYGMALALAPDDRALRSLVQSMEIEIAERKRAAVANALRLKREAELRGRDADLRGRIDALVADASRARTAGDLGRALELLAEAHGLSPSNQMVESFVADVKAQQARAAEAARAAATQRQKLSELRRRVEKLVGEGRAREQEGGFEEALARYEEARRLAPTDPGLLELVSQVRAAIERKARLADAQQQWSVRVPVRSVKVRPVAIDGGRTIDVEITVNGGPVRIGKINEFGVASKLYFQNPEPGFSGYAAFNIETEPYMVTWEVLNRGSAEHTYLVTIGKQKPEPGGPRP